MVPREYPTSWVLAMDQLPAFLILDAVSNSEDVDESPHLRTYMHRRHRHLVSDAPASALELSLKGGVTGLSRWRTSIRTPKFWVSTW